MAKDNNRMITQLSSMLDGRHDRTIVFPFMFIDGKKYDTMSIDNNEVGIISSDGTWFIPLQELSANELKALKNMIIEN